MDTIPPEHYALEPNIVDGYTNKLRGHVAIKTSQIGLDGLRNELTRMHGMVLEGLKNKGTKLDKIYPRDARRTWETIVKTADEISALRGSVELLEEVVHASQTVEDIEDEAEAEKVKQEYYDLMRSEGWLFVGDGEDPHGLLGKNCRRFYLQHGRSDGLVVAFLPSDKSEDGNEYYYIEHSDGDQEDLDVLTTTKAVRYMAEDALECEEEDLVIDHVEMDEGEGDDDKGFDDEEETLEDEDGEEEGGESTDRLWPSREVRARWLTHLQASQTVSEVALALTVFIDHVRSFDALGPDPLDLIGTAKGGLWGNGTSSRTSRAPSRSSQEVGGPPSSGYTQSGRQRMKAKGTGRGGRGRAGR